jgi:hypothetical protein
MNDGPCSRLRRPGCEYYADANAHGAFAGLQREGSTFSIMA